MARVAVDVPLANLDRPFDYVILPEQADQARPGVRVRVRFAGRLRDGFILDVVDASERDDLLPLHRIVSAEPVLSAEVAQLVRAVADHYAGGFADVVRLAVPPRHGVTEKAPPPTHPAPLTSDDPVNPLNAYPAGAGFVTAVAAGGRPRAAWTVLPRPDAAGDWAAGLVVCAHAALKSGRGALLLVPERSDLELLADRCTAVFGRGSFVTLSSETGPAARYRSFLAASRGGVGLVLGTRSAVFAPVANLGLIAQWDDGHDAWAEPRAPYPHVREVAILRAHLSGCGLLLASRSRTAEVHRLAARGWLGTIEVSPAQARHECARVVAAVDSDLAFDHDPFSAEARLPHRVFTAIRAALAAGPVLVQVPRAGYLPVLVCQICRELARCPSCSQTLASLGEGPASLACPWCGPIRGGWRCPHCRDGQLRSAAVGVARTAEEFGKAFPGTRVLQSSADHPIAAVDGEPALVLATPGTEPPARHGYAAAVLLDAAATLRRPELRAAEEALRRWLAVTALVRPAEEDGTVLVVGPASERAVQALVRLDPVGFAERELADRREAGFPPEHKLVTMDGTEAVLMEALEQLGLGPTVGVFGPFELPGRGDAASRVTLRCSLAEAAGLIAAIRTMVSIRSARKAEGIIRVRVDPQVVG